MRLLSSTLTQISSQTASQHTGSTHGLQRTSSTHASKGNRDQPTGEVARETGTSNFVLHTILTLTSLTKSSLLRRALPWHSSKPRLLLHGPPCGRQLFEAANCNSAVSAALVTAEASFSFVLTKLGDTDAQVSFNSSTSFTFSARLADDSAKNASYSSQQCSCSTLASFDSLARSAIRAPASEMTPPYPSWFFPAPMRKDQAHLPKTTAPALRWCQRCQRVLAWSPLHPC